MSPPNKITELPPGFIAFAKSMKPNQIDSLNALMHTSAPDAATRSVATAAVILTMGQAAGPHTVIEPPGFLLINATGASGDPIDSQMHRTSSFGSDRQTRARKVLAPRNQDAFQTA
jgi:hypothetical protein